MPAGERGEKTMQEKRMRQITLQVAEALTAQKLSYAPTRRAAI